MSMLKLLGVVWLYQHSRIARALINVSVLGTVAFLSLILIASLLRGP